MNLRRYIESASAVFAWPLDGASPLQEARDRHNVLGAPGVVTSPYGMGLSFAGSPDYMTLGAGWETPLRFDSGAQDFSLVTWVAPNNSDYCEILDKRDGLSDGYHLGIQADGVPLFRLDARVATGPNVDINDAEWHTVIVTVDRDGDMYVYTDGVAGPGAAVGGEVMASTSNVYIARRSYGAGNFYTGHVAGVVIADRVYSPAECDDIAHGRAF